MNRCDTYWKVGITGMMALLPLLGLAGCAATQPEPIELPHATGDYNPPLVISSQPHRDSLAAQAADEQLSEADWRLLERLGPRPIWERIAGARERYDVQDPHAESRQTPPAAAQRQAGEPIDFDALPVTIVPLGEDRVRLIWVLRHFGGSTVASRRDGSTNRRDVSITAADLTPLVNIVERELGEQGSCSALPSENTLIINCPAKMKPSMLELLARLDVPPRQVEITARIFEVSQDFDFQQGTELVLNHIASDGSQEMISTFSARRFLDAATNGGAPVQGSALRLMQVFDSAGIGVDVTFQLLAESGMLQVISAPRITVAVGQTGYMLAGQELPIQTADIVSNVLRTATHYKPVGVQLYITPQSAAHNQVKLHTIAIVSSIAGFSPLPTMDGSSGFTEGLINPIIDAREAETSVTVGDGDTLVISGLRMVRNTTRENKIPWLGDVPGLEWMFKNHRTQQQMTDLYFFITPHILRHHQSPLSGQQRPGDR